MPQVGQEISAETSGVYRALTEIIGQRRRALDSFRRRAKELPEAERGSYLQALNDAIPVTLSDIHAAWGVNSEGGCSERAWEMLTTVRSFWDTSDGSRTIPTSAFAGVQSAEVFMRERLRRLEAQREAFAERRIQWDVGAGQNVPGNVPMTTSTEP